MKKNKKNLKIKKIGVVDTTFSRVDMGKICVETLEKTSQNAGQKIIIERVVVPGIKDLPVACKKLIEEKNCSIVLALGMPGPAAIDETCAHEANLGMMWAQLLTNTHILGVFVHESEVKNDEELLRVTTDRVSKHAVNAFNMVFFPQNLLQNAGKGKRQGFSDKPFVKI